MNTQIIKPIITAWLVLATSSLQAWQSVETSGGNTAEHTSTAPRDTALPVSRDEPGALSNQVHTDRVAESESIIITWSENNDELRGYSSLRGGWETLRIKKQNAIAPIVRSGVAAIRIGDSIAAFSGVNSWWDVIQLSSDSVALPNISNDLVQIEDNGHLYTFSAAKSRWTSPTDPELQEATSEIRLPYGWKRQHRQRLNEWLHSLPLYKARGIAFNFTSGRTTLASIHTARRSWLKEAEDKINEIAVQPEPKTFSEPVANLSSRPDDATGLESRIAILREELVRLDGEVNARANDLDGKTREARKQGLRKLVTKMFDLRQLLQHAEVQHMRSKLELIDANINARGASTNREYIIEHRVNEFLDSNGTLPELGAGEKTTSTTNPEMPATGTPIGLPGPPELRYGAPGGLSSLQANNEGRFQWPQPAEIAKDLRIQRANVVKSLTQLKEKQLRVEDWSKPLEQLKSEGKAAQRISEEEKQGRLESARRTFDSTKEQLASEQRDWNLAWSAYQSKVRLLRLDLEEAELAHESLTGELNRMRQHPDQGAFSVSEVQRTESRLAIARINVQRAEEMLQLYADIETTEPELNPASLDAADSTKPASPPKPVSDVQDPLLQDGPNPFARPENAVKP